MACFRLVTLPPLPPLPDRSRASFFAVHCAFDDLLAASRHFLVPAFFFAAIGISGLDKVIK